MIDTRLIVQRGQLSLLQTVVERGVENSARVLSQMVGQTIEMRSPKVKIVPLNEIISLVGPPDTTVVGIYIGFWGDASGHITQMYSEEQAMQLADMLLGLPEGSTQRLDEMETSALGEMGNVTGSFFLNAMADVTGFSIQPTTPTVMTDMSGAIMDIAVANIAAEASEALVIETSIIRNECEVSGYFLVIPQPASLQAILKVFEVGN